MKESYPAQKKSKTVLIGSSGAGNAFAALLALRRNWGDKVNIIAIDSNPKYLVTSSLLSDKFIQVPEITKPEFQKDVLKIFKEEVIDTYIPFIDGEILIAAILFEKGLFNEKTNLQIKNSKIANLCNDKFSTFLWLSENDLHTPCCFTKETLKINEDERLILKPRNGFGSQVKTLSAFKVNISQYNLEEYIIQQECEKPEITIDVCYDKSRDFFNYVCRERLEVKSGVCTKARLFYDSKLEKIAFVIADKLELNSFCFQVMKLKGEWAVTDINARLGAGTSMSYVAGMDFFSGMFAILWREDPSQFFRSLQKETFVTRQYSEFVMNY